MLEIATNITYKTIFAILLAIARHKPIPIPEKIINTK